MKKILFVILCLAFAIPLFAQHTGTGAHGSVRDYLRRIGINCRPASDATYDLGSSDKSWSTLYANSVLSNATGVLTIGGVGGTNNENLTFDGEAEADSVRI